jgi:hypothetical protein
MDLLNIKSSNFLGGVNVHNLAIIAGLGYITFLLYKK